MPEKIRVELTSSESVTAMVYVGRAAGHAGVTLLLGHGAGAGQASGFMVSFASGLAARGIDVVTFDFNYMERGRRIPDPNGKLEACYRTVIETFRQCNTVHGDKLAIGGKSMGGRIASQVAAAAAEGDVAALVLLGYPLHPPGKPEQLRASHLAAIKAPMLFVQGSGDAFGTPGELGPIIAELRAPARLWVVEGGDHSFKVPKRGGVRQDEVYETILNEIERFLREVAAV